MFGDIRSARLAIEEGVTFVGKTEVNPNKFLHRSAAADKRGAQNSRAGENVDADAAAAGALSFECSEETG